MSDSLTQKLEAANAAIKELGERITSLEMFKPSTGALSDTDRAILDRAAVFLDKWEPATAPETAAPGK